MLNFSQDAYIFAQALDNSGEPEYWVVSDREERYKKLGPADERLGLIREQIDEVSASKRQLPLQCEELDCRASLLGVSVVTIRPATLDVDGRISPVLILFNLYGGMRVQTATALRTILGVMGRELSQRASLEINKLHRMLSWPWPLLFLALLFAKPRSKN